MGDFLEISVSYQGDLEERKRKREENGEEERRMKGGRWKYF